MLPSRRNPSSSGYHMLNIWEQGHYSDTPQSLGYPKTGHSPPCPLENLEGSFMCIQIAYIHKYIQILSFIQVHMCTHTNIRALSSADSYLCTYTEQLHATHSCSLDFSQESVQPTSVLEELLGYPMFLRRQWLCPGYASCTLQGPSSHIFRVGDIEF